MMCISWLFSCSLQECVRANDCSINSDKREGVFAKRIRTASLNSLIEAIGITSVSNHDFVMFLTFLINVRMTTWNIAYVFLSTRLTSVRVNGNYE